MPRLKHSIPAELPPAEQLDLARLQADCASGACDLVVVLGSSLTVHPAASIPLETLRAGGRLAIVNKGATPSDGLAFFLGDDLAAFADAAFSFLGQN